MSEHTPNTQNFEFRTTIVNPIHPSIFPIEESTSSETPVYEAMARVAEGLDKVSSYPCALDYNVYRKLELRYLKNPPRGGITCKTDLKLVNFHPSCFKCHYTLELDTYGRGCIHECAYCYAKDELSLHGYWNNPIPFPINFNEIRKIFYTVFETDKKSKWRDVLAKRVPLRIGSMSDSFMWTDLKYGITRETIRLLNYYKYPHVVFTRSDLAAHEQYLSLYDPSLTSIQFSICGTSAKLTKLIEPGAPSLERRLVALKKIGEAGIRTAVRINPLFPTYPDGYFSDYEKVLERFGTEANIPKLEFFDIDASDSFFDSLAEAKVKTVLAGFVRTKSSSINLIKRETGIDLYPFFRPEVVNTGLSGNREKKFSDAEIGIYYSFLREKTKARKMNFSTCYIGNGTKDFYQYQNLWDNKKDCCDIRGNVAGFKNSAQDLDWDIRKKFATNKAIANEGQSIELQFDTQLRKPGHVKPVERELRAEL